MYTLTNRVGAIREMPVVVLMGVGVEKWGAQEGRSICVYADEPSRGYWRDTCCCVDGCRSGEMGSAGREVYMCIHRRTEHPHFSLLHPIKGEHEAVVGQFH